MTDEQLVTAIRSEKPAEQQAVRYIYHHPDYQKGAQQVVRSHGQLRLESWEGVYSESIIQLIKSIKKQNYQPNRTLLDYFKGICRNVCRDLHRKETKDRKRQSLLDTPIEDLRTPHVILWDEEVKDILRAGMQALGDVCEQALQLWSLGYSMKEIAATMEYKNDRTAISTVARCKEKLRSSLGNDTRLQQLF